MTILQTYRVSCAYFSGEIYFSEDLLGEFPSLSTILSKVMNNIGVSTEKRDMWTKYHTVLEILETILRMDLGRTSQYIFGSLFEGTSTTGLQSVWDSFIVDEESPVVNHLSEAQKYPYCLLMVQDSSTPAGYVKLQLVSGGKPISGRPNSQGGSVFFWGRRNSDGI